MNDTVSSPGDLSGSYSTVSLKLMAMMAPTPKEREIGESQKEILRVEFGCSRH